MPDAEKHVIKDFSFFTLYDISHFAELQNVNGNLERLPNATKFFEKYKEKIRNPLIMGYLTHLLTDYYWNEITDRRYTVRDKNGECIALKSNNGTVIKADKKLRRISKQNDFYLFENKLIKDYSYILPTYESNLLKYVNDIQEVQHNEEDFIKIVDFLKNAYNNKDEKEMSSGYMLYTEEQMKKDFDDSVEFIIKFLRDNNIVC